MSLPSPAESEPEFRFDTSDTVPLVPLDRVEFRRPVEVVPGVFVSILRFGQAVRPLIGIDRDEDGYGDLREALAGSDPANAASTPITRVWSWDRYR